MAGKPRDLRRTGGSRRSARDAALAACLRRVARAVRYVGRRLMITVLAQLTAGAGWVLDRLLGVETGGFVDAVSLGLPSVHAHGFRSSPWFTLQRILPRSEGGRENVLLDVGAGKGRVVLSAALSYPFRRIQGVEISPELAAVARRNVAAARHPLRCQQVSIDVGEVGSLPSPTT